MCDMIMFQGNKTKCPLWFYHSWWPVIPFTALSPAERDWISYGNGERRERPSSLNVLPQTIPFKQALTTVICWEMYSKAGLSRSQLAFNSLVRTSFWGKDLEIYLRMALTCLVAFHRHGCRQVHRVRGPSSSNSLWICSSEWAMLTASEFLSFFGSHSQKVILRGVC